MPAYSAQRRGSRASKRRQSVEAADDESPRVPELSIQQHLGLVQGIPLSPGSGAESPKIYDAARAAMCLLKEEDHVWTIETCMETINLLRARNNTLKEQLLEVDTNLADHIEARQRRIDELSKAANTLQQAKDEVEATLESERSERRRRERDNERHREADTLAFETTVKNLKEEVESLQAFSGERDRVNEKMAAIEAENAALRAEQQLALQSLRTQLWREKATREEIVQRLLVDAEKNMRNEVELSVGGAYQRLIQENMDLKHQLKEQDKERQLVMSELEQEKSINSGLRTDLEIQRALDNKSAGKIKYYMRMLNRSAERARSAGDRHESAGALVGGPTSDDPGPTVRQQHRRPGTAPAKILRHPQKQEKSPARGMPRPPAVAAANTISCKVDKGAASCISARTHSARACRSVASCSRRPGPAEKGDISGATDQGWELDKRRPHTARPREHQAVTEEPTDAQWTADDAVRTDEKARGAVYAKTTVSPEAGTAASRDADDGRGSLDGDGIIERWGKVDAESCASEENESAQQTRPATAGVSTTQGNPSRPSGRRYCRKAQQSTLGDSAAGSVNARGAAATRRCHRPWTASATARGVRRGGRACWRRSMSRSDAQVAGWGRRQEHGRRSRPRSQDDPVKRRSRHQGDTLVEEQDVNGDELVAYNTRMPRNSRLAKIKYRNRELFGALGLSDRLMGSDAIRQGGGQHYGEQREKKPSSGRFWGEDDLIQAVEDGDPKLLSPGGGVEASRAARIRATVARQAARLVQQPQQSVLIRQRLGGVGTGAVTAPRQSEIDEALAHDVAAAVVGAAPAPEATPSSKDAVESVCEEGGVGASGAAGEASCDAVLEGRYGVKLPGNVLVAGSSLEGASESLTASSRDDACSTLWIPGLEDQ